MDDGVLVALPYVVVDEDVDHVLVEGVEQHRLPAQSGEVILSPPGGGTGA